ncbi:hypothetical protein SAMN06265360_114158 [Haloechinothrix alba]|uniref:Uncharacterized protein n=1 Tax=Haloechinothrix alba TaxID=664784 RepID=A0A238YCK9_9PSEU|nr:hypothetical protein SAMN06265360_114158 [Haloechinothrix alba]
MHHVNTIVESPEVVIKLSKVVKQDLRAIFVLEVGAQRLVKLFYQFSPLLLTLRSKL